MLQFLGDIISFVFDQIDSMWILYTTAPIISSFFALWVLDRVFHIFDILKH